MYDPLLHYWKLFSNCPKINVAIMYCQRYNIKNWMGRNSSYSSCSLSIIAWMHMFSITTQISPTMLKFVILRTLVGPSDALPHYFDWMLHTCWSWIRGQATTKWCISGEKVKKQFIWQTRCYWACRFLVMPFKHDNFPHHILHPYKWVTPHLLRQPMLYFDYEL